MKQRNHNNFILTSITKILEEAISTTAGIGDGIETYALYDYVIQSVFLKMTGAQEQKMKCICWELATNNYEYRYDRYTKSPLGECSKYSEKFQVYKDLIQQIKIYSASFNIETFFNNKEIIEDIYTKMHNFLDNSCLKNMLGSEYINFIKNKIKEDDFLIKPKQQDKNIILFSDDLQKKYTKLYNHRNRCAHNTLSYQQNLPALDTLREKEYVYENYFGYFSILILIDEIMIKLYQKYLEVIE